MARAAGVQAIIDRQFPSQTHPYRIFEQAILDHLEPSHTVLDIGCGRRAPNLTKLRGRAKSLIGLDMVDFEIDEPDLILRTGSVCQMSGIEHNSVDLAYSRSVMEHIEDAERAFSEICRVLRPAGRYIFLTPNFWDYASLIAYVVPNRFHATIVRWSEGRSEEDTFPTYYRANTYYRIMRMAERNDMIVCKFEYLGQYPSHFMFSGTLFSLAAKYEKFLERHSSLHWLRGWILCVLCKPG
jgi:SAM-dependent methyltransferase